MNQNELEEKYGKSEDGNFYLSDTIVIPHPFCITERHVAHAANYFSGLLGKQAIQSAEKIGIRCGMKGCQLDYDQHEIALLVSCKVDYSDPLDKEKMHPELHKWLLAIKDQIEKDGYSGFGFIKAK